MIACLASRALDKLASWQENHARRGSMSSFLGMSQILLVALNFLNKFLFVVFY